MPSKSLCVPLIALLALSSATSASAQGQFPGDSPLAAAMDSHSAADPFEGKLRRIPELVMRRQLQAGALVPIVAEGFDEANSLVSGMISRQERTPSGVWKLPIYYWSFENQSSNAPAEVVEQYVTLLQQWRRLRPQAPTPIIIEGILLRSLAFKSTTENAAFDEGKFNGKIAEVAAFYDAHKEIGASDPMWFANRIELAADTCATEQIARFLDEGTLKFPSFHTLYFRAIMARFKCSGADSNYKQDIDKILALAKARSKEPGEAMYARLQWILHEDLGAGAFSLPTFDAARMSQGMADVIAEYDEPWNVNNFAKFACEIGDVKTARSLLPRVLETPIVAVWGKVENFTKCQQWVDSTAAAIGREGTQHE